MAILAVHGSVGVILFVRTKSIQKGVDTYGFELPFIHPGLLVGLRLPGLLTGNRV